jgi:hypothetical protein
MPKVSNRFKYDVLEAFFSIFFRSDSTASTLKDVIYNLYEQTVTPDVLLARNAMYVCWYKSKTFYLIKIG